MIIPVRIISRLLKKLKLVSYENIRYIEVSGSAYDRGLAQGSQLRDRIHTNIEFYKKTVGLLDDTLLAQVSHFTIVIKDFNSEYAVEIEAIAEGAGVEPCWIYFLNCRTELINNKKVSECTTFFFKETAIMGENWDWSESSEKLMVVIKATDEKGISFTQLTEPGILGKIGMNDRGVGVCLNILFAERDKVFGVPIHILARAVLDSDSVVSAKSMVEEHGVNTASNLLIAGSDATCADLEMDGIRVLEYTTDSVVLFHTNHYLREENKDEWVSVNSKARYECAIEKTANLKTHSVSDAKNFLSDRSEGEYALCRKYKPSKLTGMHGTVASIVMDLKAGELHVTDGNPFENEYVVIKV